MAKDNKMTRRRSDNDRAMRNAAQTLLANIRFASVDKPLKSIAIASAVPDEGKSTVSLHLARAIASGGSTVLLVECDMRRRSLAATLGVHAPSGLHATLSGATSFADSVVEVDSGFYFMDVEPHIPNPPGILASKRFQGFVREASEKFDYVVFDTPPVVAFIDAAVLSRVVDATVLVVRERYAKRSELRDAYDQLVSAGANVVGVALNFCREEKGEYYYAYYDDDGRRVRTSDGMSGPLLSSLRLHRKSGQGRGADWSRGDGGLHGWHVASMPVNRTRPAVQTSDAQKDQPDA